MAKKTMQYVVDCVDSEGFDYAIRSYSSFKEVKDKKFHELREAYEKAADALEEYIDSFRERDDNV